MKQIKKPVLVVDDDLDLRDTLTDVLVDEGYSVTTASDGFEALERLRHDGVKPGLILLDWMMPRCDGSQFRELQLSQPDLVDIPVVLLTADVRLRDQQPFLGARALLMKPVQLTRLLEVVAEYCG